MCGEKSTGACKQDFDNGSPPRVRGEAALRIEDLVPSRITPACAGRRHTHSRRSARSRDHPRVCGEKRTAAVFRRITVGSPPRVRGEDDERRPRTRQAGITPACAGRSPCTCSPRAQDGDHPRVCGEKCASLQADFAVLGSPPRVRGEVVLVKPLLNLRGITPACAGRRANVDYGNGDEWITPACAGRSFVARTR